MAAPYQGTHQGNGLQHSPVGLATRYDLHDVQRRTPFVIAAALARLILLMTRALSEVRPRKSKAVSGDRQQGVPRL
jgi:hypothetical protein